MNILNRTTELFRPSSSVPLALPEAAKAPVKGCDTPILIVSCAIAGAAESAAARTPARPRAPPFVPCDCIVFFSLPLGKRYDCDRPPRLRWTSPRQSANAGPRAAAVYRGNRLCAGERESLAN